MTAVGDVTHSEAVSARFLHTLEYYVGELAHIALVFARHNPLYRTASLTIARSPLVPRSLAPSNVTASFHSSLSYVLLWQTKVREATSNDPWGPSGTQMNEIAQLTYNQSVSSWPVRTQPRARR